MPSFLLLISSYSLVSLYIPLGLVSYRYFVLHIMSCSSFVFSQLSLLHSLLCPRFLLLVCLLWSSCLRSCGSSAKSSLCVSPCSSFSLFARSCEFLVLVSTISLVLVSLSFALLVSFLFLLFLFCRARYVSVPLFSLTGLLSCFCLVCSRTRACRLAVSFHL